MVLNEKKTVSLYWAKENFHADFFPYYIFVLDEKTRANQLLNFIVWKIKVSKFRNS
jgi:hypothetical protein